MLSLALLSLSLLPLALLLRLVPPPPAAGGAAESSAVVPRVLSATRQSAFFLRKVRFRQSSPWMR